ncbi:MAG: hypothetical protein OEQ12_03090 [Nitrosopumilus sp.]|nr:hypothetical protein [Nitrosopumilus sp.]
MELIDHCPKCKEEEWRIPLTTEGLGILCHKICNEPKIRFCGIINSQGRIVTGGFRNEIKPLDNEDLRRMLYMQSSLELSMKGEFDDSLGNVNFITTYRDNVTIITVPIKQNYLLLMSVERNTEIQQIVKKTISLFESNGLMSRKNTLIPSKSCSILSSKCV